MGKTFLKHALLFSDLVAIIVGFGIAYEVRYALVGLLPSEGDQNFALYWPAILLALGAWILLFRAFELDGSYLLGAEFPLATSRFLMALGLLMGAVLAGSYLSKAYYSRLILLFLVPLLIILFAGTRLLYRDLLRWSRKFGWGVRRVVIVGQSEIAKELGDRIRRHQELNYELLGFLYPASNRGHSTAHAGEHANSEEMARDLAQKRVDELIFTTPLRRDTAILEFVAACQRLGIQVKLIPEYYDLHTKQIQSFSIDGIPIFELKEAALDPLADLAKFALDYAVAIPLLVLVSPMMIFISLVLAVLFEGRFLRRENRVGLGGRTYTMYRFNIGEESEPAFLNSESWKSRFCRSLHRYSLSELPQLLNVLKRDMSIVGPRPETAERVRHYSSWHMRRLQVKPGMTGLAQVRGLRGIDSSDLKTKYDLEYVATFSPVLDLTLMLATLGTLSRRRKQAAPRRDAPPPQPPIAKTLRTNASLGKTA